MNKKEIEEQIHDFVEKMYQARYDDGYKDGAKSGYITFYHEGLNDAWECVKKITYFTGDGGLSDDELCEIFGTAFLRPILRDYLPSEAIQKIKDYEERQKQKEDEIRVGDEVIVEGDRVIVIKVDKDFWYRVVYEDGDTAYIHQDTITDKTGKHYDAIEEVLKELRGDKDADSN